MPSKGQVSNPSRLRDTELSVYFLRLTTVMHCVDLFCKNWPKLEISGYFSHFFDIFLFTMEKHDFSSLRQFLQNKPRKCTVYDLIHIARQKY